MKNQNLKLTNMKKEKSTQYTKIVFTILLLIAIGIMDASAQGTTASHIQQIYTWIKPVVNAILGVLCLIKLAQVVYKAFFAHREFGADLGWALAGIIIWALFNVFANDILAMFGIGYTLV